MYTQGMHIYGVTVQNENMFAPEQHEACLYTFEYLRDFIKVSISQILFLSSCVVRAVVSFIRR